MRVGQILAIEEQVIAGARLELFVIQFHQGQDDAARPHRQVANVGMRKVVRSLAGQEGAGNPQGSAPGQAHHVVAPRPGIRSEDQLRRYRCDRRSGARPLSFGIASPESYSERQLYEAALDRLSREIAVVQHSTETEAIKKSKASSQEPRRGARLKREGQTLKAGRRRRSRRGRDDAAVEDEAA